MNSPSTIAVAPQTWRAEQIEVGIFDRHAFTDSRAAPNRRRVPQRLNRHLEDPFNFRVGRTEDRRLVGDADDRDAA